MPPFSAGISTHMHSDACNICDILRVHEWDYIHRLKSACADLPKGAITCFDPPAHPQDTDICCDSFTVASQAAAAVVSAVERVMRGDCINSFVVCRPPGHHAGCFGLVEPMLPVSSQGFCLLNNIAIGTAPPASPRHSLLPLTNLHPPSSYSSPIAQIATPHLSFSPLSPPLPHY
jgi:acetoin utilization deacetylase AcuC-like enzyme